MTFIVNAICVKFHHTIIGFALLASITTSGKITKLIGKQLAAICQFNKVWKAICILQ
jgi:hypothetical protein